eukprot:scaffold9946_cov188-Amphora_coffeaeformis.AAC.15
MNGTTLYSGETNRASFVLSRRPHKTNGCSWGQCKNNVFENSSPENAVIYYSSEISCVDALFGKGLF